LCAQLTRDLFAIAKFLLLLEVVKPTTVPAGFSRNYTVSQQKHVTCLLRYVQLELPVYKIFGTLITKTIGHLFLFSHINYLVQLLYLGKLSRPKYHEFSREMMIFPMLRD